MDRLNRSRRDKLDWAAKLGLGPLAGSEAPPLRSGEPPRSQYEARAQQKQAEDMADIRRRIEASVATPAAPPPKEEEEADVDASGFMAVKKKKKDNAPKSVLEMRIGTTPAVVVTSKTEPEAEQIRRFEEEEAQRAALKEELQNIGGDRERSRSREQDEALRRAKLKAANRFLGDDSDSDEFRTKKKKHNAAKYAAAFLDDESDDEFYVHKKRQAGGGGGRGGRGDDSRSDCSDDESSDRGRRGKDARRGKRDRKEEKRKIPDYSSDDSDFFVRKKEDRREPSGSPTRNKGLTPADIAAQMGDHVGGVQRKYVGQLSDAAIEERLRRAAMEGGSKKMMTEAEAVAMLQGGGKRRR